MKKRLFIALIFFSSFAYGQVNNDYEIYSSVINNLMYDWDSSRTHLTNVVIIEKFKPNENEVEEYIETLYRTDTKFDIDNRNWHLKYDSSLINLIQKESIRTALFELKRNFLETPIIEKEKLQLKYPFELISSARYDRFFFLRNIYKGWDRFYKKYPKSAGVFNFSGIEYSENYACFYFERIAGGLFATGGIFILEKINESWTIVTYLEIWVS